MPTIRNQKLATLYGTATTQGTSISNSGILSTSSGCVVNFPGTTTSTHTYPNYNNHTINHNNYGYYTSPSITSITSITTNEVVDFVEFLLKLLEVDMDFNKFNTMSVDEKASFVRQHIIKNIIK